MNKKDKDSIIIGKTYTYFDDGKIKESRKMDVIIHSIVPFLEETNLDLLESWNFEMNDCHWLYKNETDYFIKGTLKINEDKFEEIVFVRTIDDGWFSLGYWAGRLDYDGSLTKCLKNGKIFYLNKD